VREERVWLCGNGALVCLPSSPDLSGRPCDAAVIRLCSEHMLVLVRIGQRDLRSILCNLATNFVLCILFVRSTIR
jgi:hypothetical protein